MKKFALAAALAVATSTTAFAGTIEEPIVEPIVIEEDTGGTGGAWVIPVILLLVIAAVAAV